MAAQPKPLPVHQPSYLEGGGLIGWLTTIDHKRVAVMYLASALFFMAFGGIEAMAIRDPAMDSRQSFRCRRRPTTRSSRCTAPR